MTKKEKENLKNNLDRMTGQLSFDLEFFHNIPPRNRNKLIEQTNKALVNYAQKFLKLKEWINNPCPFITPR